MVKKSISESAFVKLYGIRIWKKLEETITSFCYQDGIGKRDYGPILTACKHLKFDRLSRYQWFLLMDTLGCDDAGHVEGNKTLESFYELASNNWFALTKEYLGRNPIKSDVDLAILNINDIDGQ